MIGRGLPAPCFQCRTSSRGTTPGNRQEGAMSRGVAGGQGGWVRRCGSSPQGRQCPSSTSSSVPRPPRPPLLLLFILSLRLVLSASLSPDLYLCFSPPSCFFLLSPERRKGLGHELFPPAGSWVQGDTNHPALSLRKAKAPGPSCHSGWKAPRPRPSGSQGTERPLSSHLAGWSGFLCISSCSLAHCRP